MITLNYGKRIGDFAYRPLEYDRRLNILDGSVRSGKTWGLHPKLFYGCQYPVEGWRVITGVSKDTIYDNVLNDFFNMIGPQNYHYNHQTGLLRMFGSLWRVVGAKDEGSEKFIRGKTVGLAICDELTLMPQTFFNMLVNRMSPAGARLYATTNPDTPMHWLKTDWIDNQRLYDEGRLFYLHCTMDDNPNLTQEYRDSMQLFYKGMFYQRYILGLWVMAEGAIYADAWEDKLNTFDDSDLPLGLAGAGGTKLRVISIDYGTTNPCVFLDWRDDGTTCWCMDEYRWDSAVEMKQKSDKEYGQDLIKFLDSDKNVEVLIDPSAASLKEELRSLGFWVSDADNEVLPGIQKTLTALSKRVLRFHRRKCSRTIGEMQHYAWDKKKAARGVEEPIKVADHGPDSVRYFAQTKLPFWRLM